MTKIIALDGPPCSGKTTMMAMLSQMLGDIGYRALCTPEAATELKTAGILPGPNGIAPSLFQRLVARRTRQNEKLMMEVAGRSADPDKTVILCDSGLFRGLAYVEKKEDFFQYLALEGIDPDDVHYDAVMFLETVAKDRPELYTCLNNKARDESIEEAVALSAKTLDAWVGVQHLHLFDNSTDLAGKARRVFQEICLVLGVPMPIEPERKFLVEKVDRSKIDRHYAVVEIVQRYLQNDNPDEQERIRRRKQFGGWSYFHAIKKPISPGVNYERELRVDEHTAAELVWRVDPRRREIHKDRLCFVHELNYFELDQFITPVWDKYDLLEIETTHTGPLSFPSWINVIEEVTGNPAYSNYQLALRK